MGIAWSELISRDVAESRKFYTELLGWTASEMPAPGGAPYTLFSEDGKPVAGLMAPPDADAPAPLWFTYIAVADVDASARRAVELGGKLRREPFDIPDVGRIAIVVDPGGAAVGLYRASSM